MSEKLIIGIYHSFKAAEKAIFQLEKHGFPIAQVSIIAKDFQSENNLPKNSDKATVHKAESLKDWFASHFGWVVHHPSLANYEKHFHANNVVLVAHGTGDQIAWASAIIRETSRVDPRILP